MNKFIKVLIILNCIFTLSVYASNRCNGNWIQKCSNHTTEDTCGGFMGSADAHYNDCQWIDNSCKKSTRCHSRTGG